MHATRHVTVWCTVLALAGPLSPGRASATTGTEMTVEELTRASDLVVVGRVEHVDVHPRGPGGQPGIHTRALVQVAETLRGESGTFIEVWVHGGRLGDRLRIVPGQATFRAGEEVLLFLFAAGGGLWPTGMSRGKWAVGAEGHLVAQPEVGGLRVTGEWRSLDELRAAVAQSGGNERSP